MESEPEQQFIPAPFADNHNQMRISQKIGDLITQLRSASNGDEQLDLLNELESLAKYFESEKVTHINGVTILPFRLGPNPDYCKACGHKLP